MAVTMEEAVGIATDVCQSCDVSPKKILDIVMALCVADIAKGTNIKEMGIGLCLSEHNDPSFVKFMMEAGGAKTSCTPLTMVQQYRVLCDLCYIVLSREKRLPEDAYMATGIKSLDVRGYTQADGKYADQTECEKLLKGYRTVIPTKAEDFYIYRALEDVLTNYTFDRINWKNELRDIKVYEDTLYLKKATSEDTYTKKLFLDTVYMAYLYVLSDCFCTLGEKFPSSLVSCYPDIASRMEGKQLYGTWVPKSLPYKLRKLYTPFFGNDNNIEVIHIMQIILFIECVIWGKNADADKFVADIKAKVKTGGQS